MLRVAFSVFGMFIKVGLIMFIVGGAIGGISFGIMSASGMAPQDVSVTSAAENMPDLPQVTLSLGDDDPAIQITNGEDEDQEEPPSETEDPQDDTDSTDETTQDQNDSQDSTDSDTNSANNSEENSDSMEPVNSDDEDVPAYPPRITKEWDREAWPNEDDPRHKTVTTSDGNEVNTEDLERYTMHYINQYRADNNLSTWEYSRVLASTSRAHSYDMGVKSYFSHTNQRGEKPWERFEANGCDTAYGENLAKTWLDRVTRDAYDNKTTFTSEQELGKALLQYWQESPPHNKLLLMKGHDAAGVGIHLEETEKGWEVYATLNVCTFDENESPEGSKAG